jgi:uncharacterized protein
MSGLHIDSWLRVMAYLVVVGATLEIAHRVYYSALKRLGKMQAGHGVRALLTVLAATLPFVGVCLVTYIFCHWIDKQSPSALGLRPDLDPLHYTLGGVMVAFVSVTLIFAVGYTSGWFHIQSSRLRTGFYKNLPMFCGGMTNFVSVSVIEELVMRGYVFSVLYHGVGPAPAVVTSSMIFSIVHLFKRRELPVMFTINAFLFGVIAACIRLATGALWMPIGLHIGWNFASACVFGMPINGKLYNGGLITCTVEGPSYITGGRYSPEAGLLGTIALAFAASALAAIAPLV